MKKFLLTTLCMLCMVLFAQAQSSPLYTLQFGPDYNSKSVSSYADTWNATCDGFTWTIKNFNNNKNGWNYVKCGSKNNASIAYIETQASIPELIDSVNVFIDKTSFPTSVEYVKLIVATDEKFTNVIDEIEKDIKETVKHTINFVISTPAENCYYQLAFSNAKKTNGNIQLSKVEYYGQVAAGTVAAPVITLGANNTVTIAQEEGADIYYTLDGTEPTAASTKYTAAFTISGKTTVKAVAIKDGKSSSVTTKNLLPNTVANITEFVELANPDVTTVTGSMIALYQNGRNLYVRDAENEESYLLIYNSNDVEGIAGQYTNGDIIAGATGSFKSQAGLPEMIPSSLGAKTAGTAIAPVELSLEEIGSDMLNWYVKVSDVNITAASAANNYDITDGSREMVMYNSFYNSQDYDAVEVPEGEGFTVTGFVSVYNNTMQLIPVLIEGGKVMETVATPVFNPESGAELKAGEKITITTETEGAEIRYTTDGTEPTAESTLYTEEGIEFTEDVTIKAIAVKEGMLDSDVATASYTLYIEGSAKATFDFTKAGNAASLTTAELTPSKETNEANNLSPVTFTNGIVTFNINKGEEGTADPRWWTETSDNDIRAYKSNTMTVSLTEPGYYIKEISFTQISGSTSWAGTITTSPEGTWTGKTWTAAVDKKATEVTMTFGAASRIATVNVMYVQDTEAIEGIDADNSNAPVEYYNLQGIRVNADNMPAGIYIRRQGTAVSKVLVK